ncbi:MAG: beta-ketoacyl-[acyl-carrier-protein] synthase family protein [Bacteroidota bacterium]
MTDSIWVTGIGVASSIGMNAEESLSSFRAGKRGVGEIRILDTVHKAVFKVGEIPLTDLQMMEMLQIPETQYSSYTRTALIGMIAAREAFRDANLQQENQEGSGNGVRTALVSATTVGGMDKTEREFATGSPESGFIATHPCGDSTDSIAAFLGLQGYRTTLSTACSSGANAIIHAARLIRNGIVDRAIAGGVDALSKFTLNGFNSLMILDKDYCQPFDRNRRGLNLGEGAGYIVLESDRLAGSAGSRRVCRLSGYANTNDAYHQTASSPGGDGAYGAMTIALKMSGLKAGEIDYINAHGTGTENNDASEGAALVRLFGRELPPFSSTKPFTGHTLGAAAGLEAVFSIMAIRDGLLLPGLGFREPMEGLNLIPQREMKEGLDIRNVLSNSFGFGGNNSSLIFSKQ